MGTEEKGRKYRWPYSPTAIITVVLIIIVAASAVIWKNRLDKSAEINSLTAEINQVSQEIQEISPPAPDLEARLAEARSALAAAQTAIPPEFNRNDIIDYIISLSRECQVEVLPLSSQGWLVENGYPVLKLDATITGTFTRTNDFISRLQSGKYETLTVPEMSIARQSTGTGAGALSGDETMVATRLSISIYARSAAQGEDR
jgi:hypothetical protein